MKQHTVKYTRANCQISFIEIATEKMTHWSGNWNSKADMDAYYSDNQMHIVAIYDSVDKNSGWLWYMCAKCQNIQNNLFIILEIETLKIDGAVTPLQGSHVTA